MSNAITAFFRRVGDYFTRGERIVTLRVRGKKPVDNPTIVEGEPMFEDEHKHNSPSSQQQTANQEEDKRPRPRPGWRG